MWWNRQYVCLGKWTAKERLEIKYIKRSVQVICGIWKPGNIYPCEVNARSAFALHIIGRGINTVKMLCVVMNLHKRRRKFQKDNKI